MVYSFQEVKEDSYLTGPVRYMSFQSQMKRFGVSIGDGSKQIYFSMCICNYHGPLFFRSRYVICVGLLFYVNTKIKKIKKIKSYKLVVSTHATGMPVWSKYLNLSLFGTSWMSYIALDCGKCGIVRSFVDGCTRV